MMKTENIRVGEAYDVEFSGVVTGIRRWETLDDTATIEVYNQRGRKEEFTVPVRFLRKMVEPKSQGAIRESGDAYVV